MKTEPNAKQSMNVVNGLTYNKRLWYKNLLNPETYEPIRNVYLIDGAENVLAGDIQYWNTYDQTGGSSYKGYEKWSVYTQNGF